MSESAFIEVRGRKLEYRYFEPKQVTQSRPVIVTLHEGLGSVSMWREFPALLANATRTRVLAYSRFGHGRSDPSADPPKAPGMQEREALEVLPEVLSALGIERPVLFGHSDGASMALIYAGSAPDRVAGIIALAPHVFVEDICIKSIEATKHSYLTTDLRQKLARYHDDPDCAFWGWNNVWLDSAFRAWNIERYLPSIRCPVLAIQGYEDEYGTMEQLERMARALAHIEILKLENCRHSPHRDKPAEVLAVAQRFFDRV